MCAIRITKSFNYSFKYNQCALICEFKLLKVKKLTENIVSERITVERIFHSKKMRERQIKRENKIQSKLKADRIRKSKTKYITKNSKFIVYFLLILIIFLIAFFIFLTNNLIPLFFTNIIFMLLTSLFFFEGEIKEKKSSTNSSAWLMYAHFVFLSFVLYLSIFYRPWYHIIYTNFFDISFLFPILLLSVLMLIISFIIYYKIFIKLIIYVLDSHKIYLEYNRKIINIITNRFRSLIEKHRVIKDHKWYLKEIREKCEFVKNNADRELLLVLSKNYYFDFDTTSEGDIRIHLDESHKFEEERRINSFLEELSKFKTLIKLSLIKFGIDDLKYFEEIKCLRYLNLSHNEIIKIENMDKFPNIFSLDLSHNKIKKIQNLEILKNLEILNLSNNFIESINGLNSLYNLKQLYISENHISEIPRLKENFEIRLLNLSTNEINEIKNLDVLENLRQLDLSYNSIKEIKNLDNNHYLKILNLSYNAITEIKNLEVLNQLIKIGLSNNSITELKGLGINSLSEWNLDNNLLKGNDLIALNYPSHKFIKYNLEKKSKLKEIEKIKEVKLMDVTKIISNKFEFDFAFSFAGEDRETVRKVRDSLVKKAIRVFFDEDFESDLIGKNLSDRFKEIYGKKSKFVVIFVSEHYKIKEWTDFEFQIAREEAESRKEEFILPIRLDDTVLLGIKRDIGYSDYRIKGTRRISDLLSKKLEDFNKRHNIKQKQ